MIDNIFGCDLKIRHSFTWTNSKTHSLLETCSSFLCFLFPLFLTVLIHFFLVLHNLIPKLIFFFQIKNSMFLVACFNDKLPIEFLFFKLIIKHFFWTIKMTYYHIEFLFFKLRIQRFSWRAMMITSSKGWNLSADATQVYENLIISQN